MTDILPAVIAATLSGGVVVALQAIVGRTRAENAEKRIDRLETTVREDLRDLREDMREGFAKVASEQKERDDDDKERRREAEDEMREIRESVRVLSAAATGLQAVCRARYGGAQ